MDLMKRLTDSQLKENAAQFQIGDTIKVYAKIKEGARERVQVFEGHGYCKEARRNSGNCNRSPSVLWRRCGKDFPNSFS